MTTINTLQDGPTRLDAGMRRIGELIGELAEIAESLAPTEKRWVLHAQLKTLFDRSLRNGPAAAKAHAVELARILAPEFEVVKPLRLDTAVFVKRTFRWRDSGDHAFAEKVHSRGALALVPLVVARSAEALGAAEVVEDRGIIPTSELLAWRAQLPKTSDDIFDLGWFAEGL